MKTFDALKKRIEGKQPNIDTKNISLYGPYEQELISVPYSEQLKKDKQYTFFGEVCDLGKSVRNLSDGTIYPIRKDDLGHKYIIVNGKPYEAVEMYTKHIKGKTPQISFTGCHLTNLLFSVHDIPCSEDSELLELTEVIKAGKPCSSSDLSKANAQINYSIHQFLQERVKASKQTKYPIESDDQLSL
ncbi:MAG: hypothetical protein ACI4PF_01875 [Christensenellales bacterium]